MGVLLVVAIVILYTAKNDVRIPDRRTTARAQLNAFHMSLIVFHRDARRFPTAGEGLDLLLRPGTIGSGKPYLDRLPLDPYKRKYVYHGPTADRPGTCRVVYLGYDGIEGTEDDIACDVSAADAAASRATTRPYGNEPAGRAF
jgi:hypothetical protein